MVSPEIARIMESNLKLKDGFDPKYEFNYLRNVLPIEQRLYISLEGLIPDDSVVTEWRMATRDIIDWLRTKCPDAIIISGRSGVLTVQSLYAVDPNLHELPIRMFNEKENDILYKTDCSRLMMDEDFYDEYMGTMGKKGSGEYWESCQKRKKLVREKLSIDGELPRQVIVLDETFHHGLKALYVTQWLRDQGIARVSFGVIAGRVKTELIKIGSHDANLSAFIDNLAKAMILIYSGKFEVPSDLSEVSGRVEIAFDKLRSSN